MCPYFFLSLHLLYFFSLPLASILCPGFAQLVPVAQQQESGSDLCSAQQRSYALIASNLATLYTQRDIINRKIFLEDSRLMNVLMCSD